MSLKQQINQARKAILTGGVKPLRQPQIPSVKEGKLARLLAGMQPVQAPASPSISPVLTKEDLQTFREVLDKVLPLIQPPGMATPIVAPTVAVQPPGMATPIVAPTVAIQPPATPAVVSPDPDSVLRASLTQGKATLAKTNGAVLAHEEMMGILEKKGIPLGNRELFLAAAIAKNRGLTAGEIEKTIEATKKDFPILSRSEQISSVVSGQSATTPEDFKNLSLEERGRILQAKLKAM